MYDIRQRSMLDGWLFTLAGLAKRTAGAACVRQRCAGLSRIGLAGPPQDIAAEFSVAADAASQSAILACVL